MRLKNIYQNEKFYCKTLLYYNKLRIRKDFNQE